MTRSVKLFTSLFALTMWAALGQVHLIVGTPTPKLNTRYGVMLAAVDALGAVKSIGSPMLEKTGIEWIGVSYDLRKAVCLSKAPGRGGASLEVAVLDFDESAIVKRCKLPEVEVAPSLIQQWLADVPGRGPSFEWQLGGDDIRKDVVQSMSLDVQASCAESFMAVDPGEMRYLVAHGGTLVSYEGMRVGITENGTLKGAMNGRSLPFAHALPTNLRPEGSRSGAVVINNSEVLAVCLHDGADGCHMRVFRKKDQRWLALRVQTERWGAMRGFGRFIVVVEAYQKNQRHPESAGSAEWRKTEARMGPSTQERFDEDNRSFPGRLHLVDVETEKTRTIVTNQGDSEIILVENDTVYYRVSDRLYSAPFIADGFGPARLLATDELIRDAHWAFIKH